MPPLQVTDFDQMKYRLYVCECQNEYVLDKCVVSYCERNNSQIHQAIDQYDTTCYELGPIYVYYAIQEQKEY